MLTEDYFEDIQVILDILSSHHVETQPRQAPQNPESTAEGDSFDLSSIESR